LELLDRFSDEALWQGFVTEKDRQVLAVLYDRYLALVYGVCLKYMGEREDAKDAAMEVFEKLYETDPSQKIEKFRSWLFVVTKNHCLMKLRSKKGVQEKNVQLFMESTEVVHPLDEEETDLTPQLQQCLEQLKTEQKGCVEMFYFNKKTYEEIALKKSIDVKQVKSHIQNGKRNLKLCIESKR
jgi:RNA polymerase sigma-70 factor, ECF subfamily